MYCPKCGQQQVVDAARFCFNCGFATDGVKHLLEPAMLPTGAIHSNNSTAEVDTITFSVPTPIDDVERGMIISTLNKTGGNKTRTAELLRISLKTLHNKLGLYRSQGS